MYIHVLRILKLKKMYIIYNDEINTPRNSIAEALEAVISITREFMADSDINAAGSRQKKNNGDKDSPFYKIAG